MTVRSGRGQSARELPRKFPRGGRSRANAVAELRRLRAAGWSLPALAERYHLARSTVHRLCRGIAAPGRSEPADLDDLVEPVERLAVAAARADSEPAPAIAAAEPAPAEPPPSWGSWRAAPAVGSESGRAKLSEDDVRAIRAARRRGKPRPTYRALATRFGVSRQTVYLIVAGRTWRDV